MKSNKIIIRISDKDKEIVEEYISRLPMRYFKKWNMSEFIRQLIHDEMYYNKKYCK